MIANETTIHQSSIKWMDEPHDNILYSNILSNVFLIIREFI